MYQQWFHSPLPDPSRHILRPEDRPALPSHLRWKELNEPKLNRTRLHPAPQTALQSYVSTSHQSMPSPPEDLDICEVLCLTKGGRPPTSCEKVQPGESQEDCIRRHVNHVVAATCEGTRRVEINTISNFLWAEPTDFQARFELMLKSSKGKRSWQCCTPSIETMPSSVRNTSQVRSSHHVLRTTLTLWGIRLHLSSKRGNEKADLLPLCQRGSLGYATREAQVQR